MSRIDLREICEQFLAGRVPAEQLVRHCLESTTHAVQGATVDLGRFQRCGFPEVVFAPGKDDATLLAVVRSLIDAEQPVLVTRATPEQATVIAECFSPADYDPMARTIRIGQVRLPHGRQPAPIAVISAGSGDRPVAAEAEQTLHWMGVPVRSVEDVGVAGPHRLPAKLHELDGVAAAVVVAGMEGALPSVVAGHLPCPVIGVPTSVGYGASFGGVAALLSMLNSCAASVTVVNIDAGFKAGYVAGLMATGMR